MNIQVSVCGLYVIPGREPQGWETGLWHEELAALDLSVALEFTRTRVHAEALANGLDGTSFIAAAFHSSHITRCTGIEYADQPVNYAEEAARGHGTGKGYTVCGFYADNWQTYSGWWYAKTPRLAYLAAYENVRDSEGRYLYVANVHPEYIDRLAGKTGEPPAFGDPLATTPAEMEVALNEILEINT